MVVFDFDKTLTDKDTLFGFYRCASTDKKLVFVLKKYLLLVIALLYKAKLISNTTLKKTGVFLFLNGKSKEEITNAANVYAKSVGLNILYESVFLKIPREHRMIISASFTVYLKYIFPGENIFGSALKFTNNKVSGLELNMYGKAKLAVFKDSSSADIDAFYTDSYSDQPLIDIANEAYLVGKGRVKKIK